MFLESIDMLDVILEGIRSVGICFLVAIVWRAGRRFPELENSSWRMIQWGFLLMAVGFFVDWSDEIIDYPRFPALDFVQTWVEEIGLIGGLILATIGFNNWFHFVRRFLGLRSSK